MIILNVIKVKRLFLLVFFMNILIVAFAQVTDEQVVNMLQNARQQGMGQEEMLLMLSQKGVTQEQLMRIKENYGKNLQISRQASETTDRMRKEYPEKTKKTENSKIVKNSKTIKNNNEDKTEIKEELLNIKENEDTFLDSLFMAMTPKEQEKEKKKRKKEQRRQRLSVTISIREKKTTDIILEMR